jgi:23S rRNA pseudouridine2604 synthase
MNHLPLCCFILVLSGHRQTCAFTSLSRTFQSLSILRASSDETQSQEGIRLNKVFKQTHSRREADKLIESGRVTVNGVPVDSKGGFKVVPFVDQVALDGKIVKGWEAINAIAPDTKNDSTMDVTFEYIKYYKPTGVICTTDLSIEGNIIHELESAGFQSKQRVYPVGRLDKDTSGLILLTSDGRLPNAALRGKYKQPKIYQVMVDLPVEESDIQKLQDGVVISTVAQRDGKRAEPLVAKTRPCQVEQLGSSIIQMTLVEGRNRQIRKMLGALGYTVVKLRRIQFMGLTLEPMRRPGDFKVLNQKEVGVLTRVIAAAEDDQGQ